MDGTIARAGAIAGSGGACLRYFSDRPAIDDEGIFQHLASFRLKFTGVGSITLPTLS
jgi:hypothetical protein